MMRELAFVGLVAVTASVGLGVWAGRNATPPATVVAVRQNAPLVAKPGRQAVGAAKAFAVLEPPPPPAPKPPGPPAPPPLDVAVPFRAEVRALEPQEGRLLLAGSRPLKLGDAYREGWRLTGVTDRTATLTKGKEVRIVDFFAPDPAKVAALAQTSAPASVSQVSFTNGLRPGQLPGSLVNQLVSMMRQSGIGEGQIENLKRSLEMGSASQGSLMPIIMGMARQGRVPAAQLTRFVESLSRQGIIPPEQVQGISMSIAQVSQSRQTDQIVQQLNRPGNFNNSSGQPLPNAGFPQGRGGRGGGPGFQQGGPGPRGGFAAPAAPTPAKPPGATVIR